MRSKVVANFEPLLILVDDLAANRNARVKVGVLANKDPKRDKRKRFDIFKSTSTVDKIDNPTLGLVHEFGSASLNIPARSFLRVPLATELPNKMRAIGKGVWQALVTKQGMRHALDQLGLLGVQVVEMAFRTGGFGRWQPLKAATIRRKGSAAILIDRGQLRRSISHAVVGGQKP